MLHRLGFMTPCGRMLWHSFFKFGYSFSHSWLWAPFYYLEACYLNLRPHSMLGYEPIYRAPWSRTPWLCAGNCLARIPCSLHQEPTIRVWAARPAPHLRQSGFSGRLVRKATWRCCSCEESCLWFATFSIFSSSPWSQILLVAFNSLGLVLLGYLSYKLLNVSQNIAAYHS